MSKIIRSEQLSDCEAWLVPEVKSGNARKAGPITARQLEEIQEQARREGFAQGLQEGRDAGLKELQERARVFDQVLQSLDKPFAELDSEVEQQLVRLAMLVARQLVRRELKTEPDQVIAVVREALSALPVAARNIRLALHPEDAALVRKAMPAANGEPTMQIVDDPVQTRGGCRVFTDNSQIDASVEARLNALIAHVLGGQRSTDPEPE